QVPLVEVAPAGAPPTLYARVAAAQAEGIVRSHFRPQGALGHLKAAWTATLDRVVANDDEPVTRYAVTTRDGPLCAFLGPQKHIATEHYGTLDPLSLDDYLAHGGFVALRRVLDEVPPEQVVE